MARNASRAQVTARYKAAGIMEPKVKLVGEELERHVRQRSTKFDSAKGRNDRSRSNSRRNAIACAY